MWVSGCCRPLPPEKMSDSSVEMIYSVYDADLPNMKTLLKDYKQMDKNLRHPLIHEVIEQGGWYNTGKPVHLRQTEQLKYFLTHPLFQNVLVSLCLAVALVCL